MLGNANSLIGCSKPVCSDIPVDGPAPGLIGGCYLIDSVRLSTFESFFTNSTHYDYLLSYVKKFYYSQTNVTFNLSIHPLVYDPSVSRFPEKTSISKIASGVFLERWNISLSFDEYYRKCSPSACKYTTTGRTNGFFQVLLTLVSMIGGLSIALLIITPMLVKFVLNVFKPKRKKEPRTRTLFSSMKNTAGNSLKAVSNLNIFPARVFGSRTDRSTAKHLGEWSTRLYILFLATALGILTFRTLIYPEIFTKTYTNPSLNTYTTLVTSHGNTLQCPCSLIASPYSRFLTVEVRFHQVRKNLSRSLSSA